MKTSIMRLIEKTFLHHPKKKKKEVSQQEKHFYTNRKDNNHSNYHSIKAEESFDTFFALCYSKWIHTVQHCHFCFRRESKIWKKKTSFRARDQHTRELMLLLFWPAFNLLPSFLYFYFFFFFLIIRESWNCWVLREELAHIRARGMYTWRRRDCCVVQISHDFHTQTQFHAHKYTHSHDDELEGTLVWIIHSLAKGRKIKIAKMNQYIANQVVLLQVFFLIYFNTTAHCKIFEHFSSCIEVQRQHRGWLKASNLSKIWIFLSGENWNF